MLKKLTMMFFIILSVIISAGCASSDKNADDNKTTEQEVDEISSQSDNGTNNESENETNNQNIDSSVYPQLEGVKEGDDIAIIDTDMGTIKVWFFNKYAPKAVENFITHAKEGYYDGLTFHRVIENFVIQGGDPLGDGTGGESIWKEGFPLEVNPQLRHFRGALCMARANDPNSNGSQFYFVQNPELNDIAKQKLEEFSNTQEQPVNPEDAQGLKIKDVFPQIIIDEYKKQGGEPSLDLGYTVFGQVYEGIEVIDKIAKAETDSSDKPVEDIKIKSIKVGKYPEGQTE